MSIGLLKQIAHVVLLAGLFWGSLQATARAQTPTPTPAAVVKVSSINDVDLATYPGSGDLTGEDQVCIYNSVTSDFKITFTTATGAFNFSGAAGTVPFTLRFRTGSGAWTNMSYNTATGFTGASTAHETCSGMTNASYEIRMAEADLVAARPGSYSASLTILLEQP